ncbi:MAG: hypothetical protein ACTIA5_01410 [Brachybacterium tyrofermentans]
MAEKKNESVTLVKNGRKVTTSLPREIVQHKAAGWREEKAAEVPEADSSKDLPKSEPAKSAPAQPETKGGSKK